MKNVSLVMILNYILAAKSLRMTLSKKATLRGLFGKITLAC